MILFLNFEYIRHILQTLKIKVTIKYNGLFPYSHD